MNVQQQFDIFSGPIVDSSGRASNNLVQLLLALWNRTGQAPGVTSADLEIVSYLTEAIQGSEKADMARATADAAAALTVALLPRSEPQQRGDTAFLALLAALRPQPQASKTWFGTGAPTALQREGDLYFDTTSAPYAGYVQHSGAWVAFT